ATDLTSAGAVGKDALAALGLSPGFVGNTADKSIKTFGLNLANTLNLNDPASIKAARRSPWRYVLRGLGVMDGDGRSVFGGIVYKHAHFECGRCSF
ncbi:MAG: hypothetical protein J0I30_07915, partial [Burkholderiales bacterium]|nr:hypothetical protein [Burkholderiales bacterium]